MELPRLIEALSDPAAFSVPSAGPIVVHQTHISAVFLAGDFAYKIKKPVALGFLDYSTLERRRHFCEEEVRLNRRLAPDVYLGVVPIVRWGDELRVEGTGEPVEWAVKMRRLPDSATLRNRLAGGEVDAEALDGLARRLAQFHRSADSGPAIAACCSFETVAANARENFVQVGPHVGVTLSRSTLDRLRDRTESALTELRPTIDARAARGVPRETHGDLRLDHVYWFPDRLEPADWIAVDCIEFNPRYRHADPVADIAFLAMELALEGRHDLASAFAASYLRAADDADGAVLLPFYRSYRAAVRGKVEGMKLQEPEIPEPERASARRRGRALWLRALVELEPPGRRPCLVLLAGLPGTGKSTLAHGLAERAGFSVIRSDEVRKQLAGRDERRPAPAGFAEDIYTPEWDDRTYGECLRRAEEIVFEAGRALVDASFRDESRRRDFLDAARDWGVSGRMLLCRADPDVVRGRLATRRDDASDADWSIYREVLRRWDEPGPVTRAASDTIDANSSPLRSLDQAVAALRGAGLLDPTLR
ncbi:MAG: bifunctional aminoglycoside phosphotransferase/ATP-binding protein [Isosphaeraceae bacterium]